MRVTDGVGLDVSIAEALKLAVAVAGASSR
jgi:hypothetical protein